MAERRTEQYRGADHKVASTYTPPTKTKEDVDKAEDAEKLGTTAGKGLGAKGKGGSGMPKMEPGESPATYGERLRKWREKEQTSQQRAFEGRSK